MANSFRKAFNNLKIGIATAAVCWGGSQFDMRLSRGRLQGFSGSQSGFEPRSHLESWQHANFRTGRRAQTNREEHHAARVKITASPAHRFSGPAYFRTDRGKTPARPGSRASSG